MTRTVLGIVLATFFSDVSHEMATAVLPFYLVSIGLGAAALGLIEGVADLFISLSKLGGGFFGHRARRKKPWASAGYVVTALGTGGLALAGTIGALVALRTAAWIGRGFRSPLRDYLLSDAVEPTHYGRVFGLERAGDMLGAVLGPLIAAGVLALGLGFREMILWTVVPGLIAAGSFFFMTKERVHAVEPEGGGQQGGEAPGSEREGAETAGSVRESGTQPARIPRVFWLFLGAVLLFGLGDFARSFLILIAAQSLGAEGSGSGEGGGGGGGALSLAVLLYAGHNLVAAVAAYPAGHLGDRRSKRGVLVAGYALGVVVNLLLAIGSASIGLVAAAIVLSGVSISIEQTLEKAVAAEMLPRHQRSLGFGLLACANAVGDMASSIYVGLLLSKGHAPIAFGLAAAFGAAGIIAMQFVGRGSQGVRE